MEAELQIKQDPEIKRTVCYENNSIKANCSFTRATSQSLLLFRNACRGFSFNQLRMQKECADGNMIEKAG